MMLPFPSETVAVLAELRAQLPAQRFVLIGASALAVHVPLHRRTYDIDLLFVTEGEDLHQVLAPLGWAQDRRISYRYRKGSVAADVLAVTEGALARGYLEVDGNRLSLAGCELALSHAVILPLHGPHQLEVASLESIFVLKTAAYLDRPERGKDLGDIAQILRYALPDDDERRWDPCSPWETADSTSTS